MSGPVLKRIQTRNRHLRADYAQVIGPLLQGAQDYALLDFPRHNNIGDAAIYLGEIEFLAELTGKRAAYVTDLRSYHSDIDTFCPEGPILLHGGGNFGDLWTNHHEFRLQVLEKHVQRRVVQLPQSLHFESGGMLERTKRAIGAHRDFTLCVRDLPSKEFAEREFECPVVLAPDGAHCIGEVLVAPAQDRIGTLARTDKEIAYDGLEALMASFGPVFDWPLHDVSVFFESETWFERQYQQRLHWHFPRSQRLMAYREQTYRRRARRLVDRGTVMLSQADYIVSDRLHGHILCLLLGKTHIALDSLSGKVSAYIEEWGSCGISRLASSPEALRREIEALP